MICRNCWGIWVAGDSRQQVGGWVGDNKTRGTVALNLPTGPGIASPCSVSWQGVWCIHFHGLLRCHISSSAARSHFHGEGGRGAQQRVHRSCYTLCGEDWVRILVQEHQFLRWKCSIFLLYPVTLDPSRQLYFILQMKSKCVLAALKIYG